MTTGQCTSTFCSFWSESKKLLNIDKNYRVTHNPSETEQNQLLLVRLPNLGSDDIIVPRTTNLSFDIELSSKADPNRMLVSNRSSYCKEVGSQVREERDIERG